MKPHSRLDLRQLRAAIACVTAMFALACGPPPRCTDTPLAETAASALPAVQREVGFPLTPPCTFGSGFRVERVFTDPIPGPQPRLRANYLVTRGQGTAFTLSESEAMLPFTAIPQGTWPIGVTVRGTTAAGFNGPSGDGHDLAYLRWRRDGITYELSANLGTALTERDVLMIVTALIEQTGTVAPAGATPGT